MPTTTNAIQPMFFDPPMQVSVTPDELLEICKESRESHFSFLLSDEEIAEIPADAKIDVLWPWLHTNYKGDQNVRLAVQIGERGDRTLDVNLAAWERIFENGRPEAGPGEVHHHDAALLYGRSGLTTP